MSYTATIAFNDAVTAALAGAGGIVKNVSPEVIRSLNTLAKASFAELDAVILSTNSIETAEGVRLKTIVTSMLQLFSARSTDFIEVLRINPNLFEMAAVYYGDATMWKTIADATGLTDPQGVGVVMVRIPNHP